ncbi:hypothetical protein [Duganella sp. HH101]|uniref:SDH family Clp fold serine proteinase n=1 Tax=Duganella sp. HH101 TaxID=1781066 RepID=UPI00087470BE|nr:hypothetical protein [Duganella sp. HH101]OFA00788.1 serine dehydrogenase proteinase [Duganella sp. HH101]
MQHPLNEHLPEKIKQVEALRGNRVLVLAASRLDMEMLPALYQQLRAIGRSERLDVVLQCRGGMVNAARRIALLLRQYSRQLCFIVPHYCQSSATLLTLAADDIIAGELAMFSPIDPHLQGDAEGGASTAVSSQDIKLFGEMCAAWFGAEAEQARTEALSLLSASVFPPTLTAFYRTTLELRQIGEELLRYQLPQLAAGARANIVEQLMSGYHSHDYAITGEEMAALGLRVGREPRVEDLAWDISLMLQAHIGGGARPSVEAPVQDALLATRDGLSVRYRRQDGLLPRWSGAAGMSGTSGAA